MRNQPHKLHDGKKGAALALRVKTRGKRNEISEVLSDGTIKIQLTAPPVDGKANEALLKFLASTLDVSVTRLEIVAGSHGKDKLVSVLDMDAATLNRKILVSLRR
jgi:uncharacterized protein